MFALMRVPRPLGGGTMVVYLERRYVPLTLQADIVRRCPCTAVDGLVFSVHAWKPGRHEQNDDSHRYRVKTLYQE